MQPPCSNSNSNTNNNNKKKKKNNDNNNNIDCLRGYSSSFVDALKKVGLSDRECRQIVRNAQKIVVTEGISIMNKFKMLVK